MFLLLLRNFNNLNWFLNGVINCIDDIVNGLIRNVFRIAEVSLEVLDFYAFDVIIRLIRTHFQDVLLKKSETEVIYNATQTFFRPKTFYLLITEGHSLSIQFNVCIYEYA